MKSGSCSQQLGNIIIEKVIHDKGKAYFFVTVREGDDHVLRKRWRLSQIHFTDVLNLGKAWREERVSVRPRDVPWAGEAGLRGS